MDNEGLTRDDKGRIRDNMGRLAAGPAMPVADSPGIGPRLQGPSPAANRPLSFICPLLTFSDHSSLNVPMSEQSLAP